MIRHCKVIFLIAVQAFGAFHLQAQNQAALVVSFNTTNGGHPYDSMTPGIDGNLYGTTGTGGTNYQGTIFELTSNNVLITLVNFNYNDGSFPVGKLLRAADHNFYGTTYSGGSGQLGSIFEFTTNDEFISLFGFDGTNYGATPWAGLIQVSNANFYGTTASGGDGFNGNFGSGSGTIFMMTTNGVVSNIYTFTNGSDGQTPYGNLVLGTNGNLYGTTYSGGTGGGGVLFEWKLDPGFTPLIQFNGQNGENPAGSLLRTRDGFLIGTTAAGGSNADGEIFKTDYNGNLTQLHIFTGLDGATPYGPLECCDDCYYGTTYSGGLYNSGSIYRIRYVQEEPPKFESLYSYHDGVDGGYPEGGVTLFHNHIFVMTTESTLGTTYLGGSLIELINGPRLEVPTFTPGTFSLETSDLQPGWNYQLQYSKTLLPGSWVNWGAPVTAPGYKYTFSESVSGAYGYERLQVTAPGQLPP